VSDHYLVRCTGCKAIITQCRCPGPKAEREGRCNTCETSDEIAALRSQLSEKDAEIERLRANTILNRKGFDALNAVEARAEKAEAEVERLRVVGYEIIASRIENIKEREAEKARAEKLKDAGEMLWVVVANVSGGNWKLQSQEWQDAAAKWRDNYFAIAARALAGEEK